MEQFLNQKQLKVWIACLAILCNLLVPSLSHALSMTGLSGKANLVEICSASGTKFVPFNLVDKIKSSSTPLNKDAHKAEHCQFCVTHAGSDAIPPTTTLLFAVMSGRDLFPSLFYHSPAPLFSWAQANPRAPPLLA